MTSRRQARATRLYGACLHLLPPTVRRHDGEEMVLAFADLWAGTEGTFRRFALAVRVFGRLPLVVVLEWLDLIGLTGSDTTGGWKMKGWGKDVRFAFRTLSKAPAFTLTSVALIGLGVGAVTTIFTLVDHVLLRPLPYPAADRLVTVENGSHSGLSFREFQRLSGVEAWAAGTMNTANLTGEGDPIGIEQATVTEDFFSFFGARPAVGRLLVRDDFDAVDVVVLAHTTWRNVFGEDAEIVGRAVRIDDQLVTVVGVLGADFEPPQNMLTANVDLYRPIDWS